MAQKKLMPSSVRGKRAVVDASHPEISIVHQCDLLGLHRSSYYRKPSRKRRENTVLLMSAIDEIYTAHLAGFLGLFSILLLLYRTLRWSYRSLSKRGRNDPYKGIDVALFVFWLFWAFSEAKIDAIRQSTYFSIIMIYFGITNAMIRRDVQPVVQHETEAS